MNALNTEAAVARPDLSLVVALYFEEECVEEFVTQVRVSLDDEDVTYEIIFIDDGSTDRTVELVNAMAKDDDRIKLIQLSRNHGKPAAVSAGIAYAQGHYMVMMDPDLQDPPNRIMDFYRKLRGGEHAQRGEPDDDTYDIVFGVRMSKGDSFINTLYSKTFWATLNGLTGLQIPKNLSVMRMFNRRFRNAFMQYPERIRFIEGIFMLVGMRKSTMEVENLERFAGESKFNFRRKMKMALDAIVAYSDKPIQLCVSAGFSLLGLAFAYGAYVAARKLVTGNAVPGWTATVLIILFIGAIQIILLGLLGNYIGRIYTETKRRPVFNVLRTTNLERRTFAFADTTAHEHDPAPG